MKTYPINEQNLTYLKNKINHFISFNNNSIVFQLKPTELFYLSKNQLRISVNYEYTQEEFNKLCTLVIRIDNRINRLIG